jgi:hypothetical protein
MRTDKQTDDGDGRTDGKTERYDEANYRFLQFFERA